MNNPPNPTEEIFSWMERQVSNISHNVNLRMLSLRNNLGIFGEDGGYNAKDQLEGRSGNQEEIEDELKKGPERDQPNSSGINHS